MNIAAVIEKTCQKFSSQICVVEGNQRLTYAQIEERANRLAWAMVRMGVKPGDRVGIFQINCLQFVEIIYALTKIGAIFVSLNFRLKGQEVYYILDNAEVKILILGKRYIELIQSIREKLPKVENYLCIGQTGAAMQSYESTLAASAVDPFPSVSLSDDEPACIMYTSGTTGLPKGAIITHGNITSTFTEKYGVPSGTLLICVPLYHIAGILSMLNTVRNGETLIILSEFDPGIILKTIKKEKIATTYFVPTMLQAILDHNDFSTRNCSSLKNILYGAAPMPIDLLIRSMNVLPGSYYNNFGLTEATATISSLTPGDHLLDGSMEEVKKRKQRLSGVGKAIPEVELRIVDEQDMDVPVGHIGEAIVRGKKVMKGYWKNTEATTEILRGGWLHTGDLVSIDADGYLYLSGRKKDMIIRGGENIYPIEIETILHQHPKIMESAVVGVPDIYWGEIVKAVIVLKPGERATDEEIIAYCHQKIASYKKPGIVEFVDKLPKNAVGKVLKRELNKNVVESK